MQKYFRLFLLSFLLVACGKGLPTQPRASVNTPPGLAPIALGDLYFVNGTTELGVGAATSGTANTYLDCQTPLAFQWLPKKLKTWTVAFGIATVNSCANCTPQFRCTPGETITISNTCLGGSCGGATQADPTTFEAGSPVTTTPRDVTCPGDGTYTDVTDAPLAPNVKVTYTSASGSDTEYILCP